MKIKNCIIFIIFNCIFLSNVASSQQNNNQPIELWTCQARDNTNSKWTDSATYQRRAINLALEQCKRESLTPLSCKVEFETCDVIISANSDHPLWRCTALDQLATPWKGGVFPSRDLAAISANEFCKKHSEMPDTCYNNVLMCTNLNKES